MLRIYDDAILMTRDAGRAAKVIARHDRDLARQLRKAAASVPLNIAEGSGLRAGSQRNRYETALGSQREVRACLHVSVAFEYIPEPSFETSDRIDKIIATLVKVVR